MGGNGALSDGKYLMIVLSCRIVVYKTKKKTCNAIEAVMTVVAGDHRGTQIKKYCYYGDSFSDSTIAEFARLGINVRDKENIIELLNSLVGKTAYISAVKKQGKQFYFIERHIGYDDVTKYQRSDEH